MTVVDEQSFSVLAVAALANFAVVVGLVLGNGVWKLSGRVHVTEEDVHDGVATLLAQRGARQDGLTGRISVVQYGTNTSSSQYHSP